MSHGPAVIQAHRPRATLPHRAGSRRGAEQHRDRSAPGQRKDLAGKPRAARDAPASRRHPPLVAQAELPESVTGASCPAARPRGRARDRATPHARVRDEVSVNSGHSRASSHAQAHHLAQPSASLRTCAHPTPPRLPCDPLTWSATSVCGSARLCPATHADARAADHLHRAPGLPGGSILSSSGSKKYRAY